MEPVCGEFAETIRQVRREGGALSIRGTGSKAFLGRAEPSELTVLDTTRHAGVVDYDPGDLVVTVRAGTLLADLDRVLAEQGQGLGFEPPRFGGGTVGGAIASGLSGPVRPFAGAARDFVLGADIINGRGEPVRAGGRVIKNVAGYDLARLMAGALGTLGVMTQLSLRVVVMPEAQRCLVASVSATQLPETMAEIARRPLPLSGLAWHDGTLRVRLTGTETGVTSAQRSMGLETDPDGEAFWIGLRDQTLDFFASDGAPLWRLSHRPAVPLASLPGTWLIDWAGAQRWLRSDVSPDRVRQAAVEQMGHATLFRGGDRSGEVNQRPQGALWQLQREVKQALDPDGLFNPGRLYAGL